MAFRLIPAGSFRMGSRGYDDREEPVHLVKIPEPFWLAETPVTQAQFALWTRAEAIKHENQFKERPEHPAENLSWHEAVSFCAWLSREKTGQFLEGYTQAGLPTEAQWEYACRAGTNTEYYLGDGEAALAEAGWFGEELDEGSTHPVREKRVNHFGLFDTHGNVWEWCQDVFDRNAYRKRTDGWTVREWTVADAGDDAVYWRDDDRKSGKNQIRVLRGGSWADAADRCRAANRDGDGPDGLLRIIGFRVCLVRGPAARAGAERKSRAEAEPAPGDGGRGTSPESDGAGVAVAAGPDLAVATLPRVAGRKSVKKRNCSRQRHSDEDTVSLAEEKEVTQWK